MNRIFTHPKLLLLLSALLSFAFMSKGVGVSSRNYLVKTWQTEQGLPQNTIKAIVQTQDGYLWVGTGNGLARFNGFSFEVFNMANVPGFASDRISALLQAKDGTLWIGTEGGGVMRLRSGRFESLSTAEGLTSGLVTSLAADKEGSIWVGTIFGLNKWEDGKFVSFTMNEGLPGNEVSALKCDVSGTLWIGTDDGLAVYENGAIRVIADANFPVLDIELDAKQNLWVNSVTHGLLKRPHSAGDHFEQKSSAGQFSALLSSQNGDLWLGSPEDGLQRFSNDQLENVDTELPRARIESLYADRQGNLWVGLNGAGLARVKRSALRVYTTDDGLPTEQIRALTIDSNGRLLAAGDNGGIAMLKGDKFSSFGSKYDAPSPITTLCPASDGSLWIGTKGNGLQQYKGGRFATPSWAGVSMAAVVSSIFEDSANGLWIGTEAEGVIHNLNGKVQSFTTRQGLSRNQALSIAESSDGSIWLATANGGLNRIHDGVIQAYSKKDGLGSDSIRTLYADATGMIWVGTSAGLGLFRDAKWYHFTTQHGLADNVISQIVEDDSGNLWFGSNRGIFRVPKAELIAVSENKETVVTCVSYGVADGMLSPEVIGGRQSTALKDREGDLWFSTTRGLIRVNTRRIETSSNPSPVVIESVLFNDQNVFSQGLAPEKQNEEIRIPSRTAKLEFHFTALDLTAPEKNRFRYKLEGFDPDWLHVGADRNALYTMLPAGNYTFRVGAYNHQGKWNETDATVRITVVPRYWETVTFKVGLAGLGVLVVIGIVQVKRARRREVESLRLRIAGDLHDELGSNLSSIALLSRRLRKSPELKDQQKVELDEIQSIAKQTTSAVRDIVWFIDPKNDTLHGMVQRMKEVATVMLADVECEFEAPTVSTNEVSPDFRRNVFLIFKELLNNLVRHSSSTKAKIKVIEENKILMIEVSDNGCGCDGETRRRGNGFRNIEARTLHLNGNLQVKTSPGNGMLVRFSAKLT